MKASWLVAVIATLFATTGFASTQFEQGVVKKSAIPGEFILKFSTNQKVSSMSQFAASIGEPAIVFNSLALNNHARVIMSAKVGSGFSTHVLINSKKMGAFMWGKLSKHGKLLDMQPNYKYEGEFREGLQAPNDPDIGEQYFHTNMGNSQAWPLLNLQNKIIVAVTDDGIDLDHEDLKDSIYTNPNEIPGNGIDDDHNGYIDDVNGWDFASDDNDPRPTSGSHGTHVAGIIGASIDNGVGVAGTAAPIVELMPIRFYGGNFTSAMVAEAYRYAADNGAHIVSTSYNIDFFVGDKIFEEAIAYVYNKGLIHFNSAGNGYRPDPARKAFEELILVCSTNQDDAKSDFSNYGEGVEICAPGGDILSTLPDDGYGTMSGTSMATPNAAAAAAVLWSQHPKWTRDQVVAQLLGTADNVDSVNPNYIEQMGMGRVNTFRSIQEDLPAPAVKSIVESDQGAVTLVNGELRVKFTHRLDPKTVNQDKFILSGPSGSVKMKLAKPYKMGSDFVTLQVGSLSVGDYTLTVDSSIRDPFGQSLQGDKQVAFIIQQ
ncbi:MAG: S8 family serine peptidase [Bdellovibrionales bacterium]|nr:S8 family serine peptidase [Bdellovibrionales bacterium]